MKRKNNILLLVVVLFGLAGCNPAAKFSLVEAETPVLNGLTSLHGTATVVNSGGRDFMVESMNFAVGYRGRTLGSARLLLPIEIPAGGAATTIRYDLAFEGLSLTSLQTLQSRLMTNPDAFTVDVRGYIRWGGIRKKVALREVPLIRVIGIMSAFTP